MSASVCLCLRLCLVLFFEILLCFKLFNFCFVFKGLCLQLMMYLYLFLFCRVFPVMCGSVSTSDSTWAIPVTTILRIWPSFWYFKCSQTVHYGALIAGSCIKSYQRLSHRFPVYPHTSRFGRRRLHMEHVCYLR